MIRMSCLIIGMAVFSVGCGGSDQPVSITDGSTNNGQDRADQTGRAAVALPDDLPADIPIYPGSKPVHVGTSGGGIRQSPGTSIQLETTDPVETVQEFYVNAMEEHSWTMLSPTILHANKGERNLNVTVTAMSSRPGTVQISVIYNRPEDATTTQP